MYIDIKKFLTKNKINIKGVVHVGAHKAEELNLYRSLKIKNILLFEANPSLIKFLKIKSSIFSFLFNMNIYLENKALLDSLGEVNLNITSNSQSSSILNLKEHSIMYPTIKKIKEVKVPSSTLNYEFSKKYNIKNYNMLNMDIQGSELLVLKGSTNILKNFDLIYTEINFKEMYEGCALADDLDNFLEIYGFYRSMTSTPESEHWGDAIYIKK
jgi:FkbM family methyltransferase